MKKTQMLRPIAVGDIYPVKSQSRKGGDCLKGCRVEVTYEGVAPICKRTLGQMGLFNPGYGVSCSKVVVDSNRNTVVEYLFPEGVLFPEPFSRAKKFCDVVKGAIENFHPVRVSNSREETALNFFDELYVSGCSVTVNYPIAAYDNPFFKKFIERGQPRVVKVYLNKDTGVAGVEYFIKKGKEETIGSVYNRMNGFRDDMLKRIPRENIK